MKTFIKTALFSIIFINTQIIVASEGYYGPMSKSTTPVVSVSKHLIVQTDFKNQKIDSAQQSKKTCVHCLALRSTYYIFAQNSHNQALQSSYDTTEFSQARKRTLDRINKKNSSQQSQPK